MSVSPYHTFVTDSRVSEFPNSTGAYELDLSLANDFSRAWREMHVKSDVFCSGSIILPDKGGRQINVGGWSLDSTFGIRLYTPSGSDGVQGTTDWEEGFPAVALQVRGGRRAYSPDDTDELHSVEGGTPPPRCSPMDRSWL